MAPKSRYRSNRLAQSSSADLDQVLSLDVLPKLIVIDLDNTLWTPELYQIRQKAPPVPDKEIRLFDDARAILEHLAARDDWPFALAIASRTSKTQWAHRLLDGFQVGNRPLRHFFSYIEIQTGSKKAHLASLRKASGVAYSEMLFVDDDERMNLSEVSQLGVLCCHTPRGLTMEHWCKSLYKYSELMAGHDPSGHWMGYILNAGNLGIAEPAIKEGRLCRGRVKFYSSPKRFGFVVDDETRNEFFFHESKVPAGVTVAAGDVVEFQATLDATGRPSAVITGGGRMTAASITSKETTTMPCFTMSQPFAALLLNGHKTVESRNSPMFADLKPGTKVLLHCGRRDWHDLESYRKILSDKGLDKSEVDAAGRLPHGFSKGSIIGMIEIGRTWKSTDGERQSADLQQQVLAPADGIGRWCTEILAAQWLKKAYETRGHPGVYDVELPTEYLL